MYCDCVLGAARFCAKGLVTVRERTVRDKFSILFSLSFIFFIFTLFSYFAIFLLSSFIIPLLSPFALLSSFCIFFLFALYHNFCIVFQITKVICCHM
jgi:hypothetical protein